MLAATSKNVLRGVDILGRIGGEEFVVGLPETRLDQALLVAEKLRAAVEQAHVRLDDGRVVHSTVSLGVAGLDICVEVDDLLKHADVALYSAKENGRNRGENIPLVKSERVGF
ncbi:GGDEF domain-containing protein [Desulfoplanes sp.]